MSLLIYRLFVWQTISYRAKMNSDANGPINSKSSFGVNIRDDGVYVMAAAKWNITSIPDVDTTEALG
jgi:hypothetical protein